MANTANMVYSGQGPAGTGQILASMSDAGDGARALEGFISFTGDNSTSTVTVNFVDGVQALPFTPSAVIVSRSGGAGTSTISALNASSISTTAFTLTASATLTAAVYVFAVRIIK